MMTAPSQAPRAVPTAIGYADLDTPLGPIRLYDAGRGLVTLALPAEPRAAIEARLGRLLGLRGAPSFGVDRTVHRAALAQLAEYFAGRRRCYDLPLHRRGTPFQLAVWDAVAGIPYGETRSYGELARALGRPAASRAVGAANGANPLPIVIPCHRVVGASGRLTGYAGGLTTKRRLLELERGSAPGLATDARTMGAGS